MLNRLGVAGVEDNHVALARHFLDVATNPKFDTVVDPGNTALTAQVVTENNALRRCLADKVLRGRIGGQLLGEAGRIAAIKSLSTTFLTPLIADFKPDQAKMVLSPRIESLTSMVLLAVGDVVMQLDDAAAPLHPAIDALLKLCSAVQSNDEDFYISLGWACRLFALAIPHQLHPMLTTLAAVVEADLEKFTSVAHRESPPLSVLVGPSIVLASVLTSVPFRKLHVSYDWLTPLLHMGLQMVKIAGRICEMIGTKAEHSAPFWKKANMLSYAGWSIVTSLISLGPSFVRLNMNVLVNAWKAVLIKPTKEQLTQYISSEALHQAYWMHVAQSREGALAAMHSFFINCSDLITADMRKKLIPFLANTVGTVCC